MGRWIWKWIWHGFGDGLEAGESVDGFVIVGRFDQFADEFGIW